MDLTLLLILMLGLIGLIIIRVYYYKYKKKKMKIQKETEENKEKPNTESVKDDFYDNIEDFIKLDEEEMEQQTKLKSSEDIIDIETIYERHVYPLFNACEFEPNIFNKIPFVKQFVYYCLKKGKINTFKDLNAVTKKSWTEVKEVQFWLSKLNDLFTLPTGEINKDISILTTSYPILYENILGDSIYPFLSLAIKVKRITTKGSMVYELKQMENGRFSNTFIYLVPLLRNACNHNTVSYSHNKDLLTFTDRIKNRQLVLGREDFMNYCMEIFFLDMAFLYIKYKLEVPITLKIIEGAKRVKEMFPDVKMVPSKQDASEEGRSMASVLIALAERDKDDLKKELDDSKKNGIGEDKME